MSEEQSKTCISCKRVYRVESDFMRATSRWRLCSRGHLWFNCSCDSTIMIKKGSFPWYTPSQNLSPSAQSIFARISDIKDLPRIPFYVMELQTMLGNDQVSAKQIASTLRLEPVISALVLKSANNLKSSSEMKIESIEHAVAYVGLKTLGDLIMTASLSSFEPKTTVFKLQSFWEESYLCGLVAERLVKKFNPELSSDEVYLAGTLCNIGKLIQAFCFPADLDRIVAFTENPKAPKSWPQAERDLRVYTHDTLGELAVSFWGLPAYVTEVSGVHHQLPKRLEKSRPNFSEIVTFANQLSHWLLFQPSRMDQSIYERCLLIFNMNDSQVEKLTEELSPLKEYIKGIKVS